MWGSMYSRMTVGQGHRWHRPGGARRDKEAIHVLPPIYIRRDRVVVSYVGGQGGRACLKGKLYS